MSLPPEPDSGPAPPDAAALRRLLRNAIALRVVVAVLLHLFVSEYLFAPDQTAYHRGGLSLARFWSGETFLAPVFPQNHPSGYFYIVATFYWALVDSPLVPKVFNALLGGVGVYLVHDLTHRLVGNPAVALRAATLAAYFPSLVLWSALNIRDVWVIVLILLVCRQALVLQERFALGSLVVAVVALWGLTQFRSYIFLPVAGPMVVSFLATRRGTHILRNVTLGMVLAIAVMYIDQSAGTERRLRSVDFEELHHLRYWNTVGAQSSFEQADISTPTKALMFLPVGLSYFLLAPFPWMLASLRQALAVPETLYFYWLLPWVFRGVRTLIRERLGQSLMMLLLTAGLTVGYALGEGNAGTAYRHRAQVLSFYLIFAAVGLEGRRR